MYSAERKNQANIDAAQSTPTAFAVETLRRRNMASGISGWATRASIARKIASSAVAAPSRPSVCTEAQPALLPLITA